MGLLLAIALIGNSLCFYYFDGRVDPQITLGDALWYSIISITTIGYGDYSATTAGARIGTVVFVVIIGLSAFTMFFGVLIDSLVETVLQGERGMGNAYTAGHKLIVNFPAASRVEQLIREIQSGGDEQTEIIVVSDQIERLPFKFDRVTFIHGSPLSQQTYRRARATEASGAIVLATSYDDPNSDAVVASAVSVLDSVRPELHIVAECLNHEHCHLFQSVRCDAIVSGLRMTGNLLVQEAQDPGVSRTIDVITSNLVGDTLYSARVEGDANGTVYSDMFKRLMDHDVNVLSIIRGNETFTVFTNLTPEPGDRIVYLSSRRQSWDQLRALAGGA